MYKPLPKGKQLNRDEIIFSSGSPYPEIDITSRNQAYARQMLDNLGGSNSEMSAVCLYFYNHLMTESCSQDIAWIFHKISVVEMRHMEIFGKIALCLGEDPRLWTWRYNRRVYWTPACDRYPVELNRLI